MAPQVEPGDVLLVRSSSWQGWWIRFGAAVADKPNLVNHVAVAHHADANGTLWAIEGRPGGVGWVDTRAYLASPGLLTNAAQPRTGGQRTAICAAMAALIGTPYDWQAIIADGLGDLARAVNARALWAPAWNGVIPGQVCCSSAAAWAYARAATPGPPGGARGCQPADWAAFILAQGWRAP